MHIRKHTATRARALKVSVWIKLYKLYGYKYILCIVTLTYLVTVVFYHFSLTLLLSWTLWYFLGKQNRLSFCGTIFEDSAVVTAFRTAGSVYCRLCRWVKVLWRQGVVEACLFWLVLCTCCFTTTNVVRKMSLLSSNSPRSLSSISP